MDGHDERLQADEVAGDPDERRALCERLPDQAEAELLQVAEAAMDELGRAAARAHGQVVALDERCAQAARCRVQQGADTRDAATHDEHVEPVAAERIDGGCASCERPRGRGLAAHGSSISMGSRAS